MFRRDVVLDLGGFDESLNAAEDHDLYRKLVLARREAHVVPETLLRYRRHEQQMTIAKSSTVWESDARSYDRFLAELAPGLPAPTLRMLLRNDPGFWAAPALTGGDLVSFLDAASSRLELDAAGREMLARALASRASATMLSGWLGDAISGAYATRARALASFAARHGEAVPRLAAAGVPLLAPTVRLGAWAGHVRVLLARALRNDAFAKARYTARKWRLLRTVYARIIDTRARD
jgi:hypothetical protein